MEKREVIVSLIIVLCFFIFANYATITGYVAESGVPVSEEIIEELQEKGTVDVIVVLKDEDPELDFMVKEDVDSEQVLDKLDEDEVDKKHDLKSANGFSAEINLDGLNKIKTDLNVERIEFNHPMSIFLHDSIDIIHASDLHDDGYTGVNQAVCIVDTGINYNHPDLSGNYLGGFDVFNNDSDPMDDHGHGTHVSGIIAANGGRIGIAKDAGIVSVKVFDSSGSGSEADIIKGIEWCVEHKLDYNIVAISMSLGTSSTYEAYCDALFPSLGAAVDTAVNNDIAVIAATGNSGSLTGISSPSCLQNSIAIGSTDKADNVASYSNRNSFTDFFITGSSITSTWLSGTKTLSGTSMSVPHVSAIIAVLKDFDNSLTISQIKEAFSHGIEVEDVNQNFTRIDVLQAVLSFDETAPEVSFVLPTPDNNILINNSLFVNISSNEKLGNSILEFNSQNYSMNGENYIFYYNKSAFSGDYVYKVYGYDRAGNLGVSESRNISIFNPLNVIYNPENKDVNINEPENYTFSVNYQEENLTVNWFKNNINVGSDDEYVFLGDYDSSGTHNITVCVDVECNEWNLIVANVNRAPIFENIIGNKTWNENTNLNIDLLNHFNDLDNDDLIYSSSIADNINSSFDNNMVTLIPETDFIGESNITFYASDNEFNISSNLVKLTLTNVITCGDGKIEGNEECDGSNLNDKSCADWTEYISGDLVCTNCLFVFDDCTSAAGNSGGGGSSGGGGDSGGSDIEETFDDNSEYVYTEPEYETTSEPAPETEPNPEEVKTEESITGKVSKSKVKIDSPIWYLVFIAIGLVIVIVVLKKFGKL